MDVLNNQHVSSRIEEICNNIETSDCTNDIDENLCQFYTTIDDICTPLFRKNICTVITDNTLYSRNKWYDDECKEKQRVFYTCLKYFRSNDCDENRSNMVKARSEYKCIIRSKKFEYGKYQTRTLENMRVSNAKEY